MSVFDLFISEEILRQDIKDLELTSDSSSTEAKSNSIKKDKMVSSVLVNGDSESLNDSVLELQDERHPQLTLASLNMMRKNRHFCDVVLHVSVLSIEPKPLSTTTHQNYLPCHYSKLHVIQSGLKSFANPWHSLADINLQLYCYSF